MNATGKRARKQSGLNHSGCKRARHTHKSTGKVRRMGWVRHN